MNFGFKDAVKLASKGFKPTDIAELSALDENKFDKDDILSLVGNGYKMQEIKDLVKTFSYEDENVSDRSEEPEKDDTQHATDKKPKEDSSFDSSDDQEDEIDYKSMYEKEKQLREKLQRTNQKANKGINQEKSDFEIALDIANNF